MRFLPATSAKPSRTRPMSPTVSTRPSGSVTSGSLAISSPTYCLFLPRRSTSPLSLRIVPPGSSRFSRRTISATFLSVSPCLRSVSSAISIVISYSLAPPMFAAETLGRASRSSRTRSATSRSCSSARSSPESARGAITPTLIAGVRSVTCSTFGSSASSGKLGIRSTSERISPTTRWTSLTLSRISKMQYPSPSRATLVIFLMPETLRQASSTFWQIPSSTSAGVAPG